MKKPVYIFSEHGVAAGSRTLKLWWELKDYLWDELFKIAFFSYCWENVAMFGLFMLS